MLRVGLTGGIGSGKSTVARRLARHGAVVIDADQNAREVVEPGTDGLREVIAAFGEGILNADGVLNRPALAQRVFGDDEARARLNAIVHPRVGVRRVELIERAPEDAILVDDVPLLVELGIAPAFHLVIIVDAPVETRVDRLVRLRGLADADARARIAVQATDEQRRAVADVWLDNSGPVERVRTAVDRLWAERLAPYEANVRLRKHTARDQPSIVEYDPGWPVRAERLAARLRLAGGARALRVDHIGSTSVPGLAAPDLIELQVTVASLDDADALAEPLADAGFPPAPEFDGDRRTDSNSVPAYRNKSVLADDATHFRIVDEFTAGQSGDAQVSYTLDKIDADHIVLTMQSVGTLNLQRCE